jgi:hypothetical protein
MILMGGKNTWRHAARRSPQVRLSPLAHVSYSILRMAGWSKAAAMSRAAAGSATPTGDDDG